MTMDTENIIEVDESPKKELKEVKSEKSVPDYPVIKVQLPRDAALRVQSALQTLKERKADTKVDELLSDFLNGLTEEYLDDQIEKRTPEDFYFEAAKNIPELREKIIQQAKKLLQKNEKTTLTSVLGESKRMKKKLKDEEFSADAIMN
jgi:hypothetical protein